MRNILQKMIYFGLILVSGACAGTQVVRERPYPAPSSSQLYTRFQADREHAFLVPVVAIATVDIPGQSSFDVRLVVRRPGHFRLEAPYKHPLSAPFFFVATDGRTLWMDDERNNWSLQGAASACVLNKPLGSFLHGMDFPFSADDLAEIFLGGAPLLEKATVASDHARWIPTDRGREELEIQNAQYMHRMQFFPVAGGSLHLARVERWDRRTRKLLWSVRHDRFAVVFQGTPRQAFLPGETHLRDESTGREVTLRWRKWDADFSAVQKDIPAGETLFSLAARPDSPFRLVQCGQSGAGL